MIIINCNVSFFGKGIARQQKRTYHKTSHIRLNGQDITMTQLVWKGMGSSDLAIPDFESLTCGPCIWWDPHVSDSKSGKVRIGKLENPAPYGRGVTIMLKNIKFT
jgi:hypothetical protein